MKTKFYPIVLAALFLASNAALAASYNEVRDRIYAHPLKAIIARPGLSITDFARAWADLGGRLINRVRGTLTRNEDFKDARPKLLHPMGVCATGIWEISGESGATGLLAKGTRVPAIVRLSSGDEQTRYQPGKTRMLGIALKLFPTQDEAKSVETRNLFFLDQYGLDGSNKDTFLLPMPGETSLYFENTAKGGGKGPAIVNQIFARFDSDPTIRPIYPLTEVTADGHLVTEAKTPQLLRLVPNLSQVKKPYLGLEFREELMQYRAGEIMFEIHLPKVGRIGTLTLGAPVMSETCDLELHFHHHPNR